MSVNILVAENDLATRCLLKAYLEKNQFNVTVAHNEKSFFTHFFNLGTEFSLVILDIMLKDTDGFSLRNLVRLNSTVPIIMLTNGVDVFSKPDVRNTLDFYISRPFNPADLLTLIGQICSKH